MTLPERLAHLPDRKRRELERAAQILFDELEESLKTKLSEKGRRGRKRCFTRLDRAYVGARYSPAYEITGEELAWLVDRVTALQEAVAAICAERLAGPAGA